MFSAFLDLRARGMHEEANFVIIEIVDQCVRHQSGGELGTFYGKMRQMDFRERSHWQLFVASRNGEGLDPMGNLGGEENRNSNFQDFCTYIRKAPFMAYIRLRRKLHNLGIKLLLPAFRRQNVSFTAVGEKHCWLWDLHQLRNELVDAGFSSVTRQSHRSSSIEDFPLVPLDSTNDGRPRKGLESMYVEARI